MKLSITLRTILAMSTIGDLPSPKTKGEYMFVIFELMIGLLTFATVLGYVANIVTNMSAARKDFQGEKGRKGEEYNFGNAFLVSRRRRLMRKGSSPFPPAPVPGSSLGSWRVTLLPTSSSTRSN